MIYSKNKVMKVIGAMPVRLALQGVTSYIIRLIEKVSHKKKPKEIQRQQHVYGFMHSWIFIVITSDLAHRST